MRKEIVDIDITDPGKKTVPDQYIYDVLKDTCFCNQSASYKSIVCNGNAPENKVVQLVFPEEIHT